MHCTQCNKDLSRCACEDLKERLNNLKNDPLFIYKMCRICQKHYATCKCEKPDWTTSHDGVELSDLHKTIQKKFGTSPLKTLKEDK